jgi:hypothetical protein
MRYSKRHVNEIVDSVMEVFINLPDVDQYDCERKIELIKEEHLLVDRRVSSLPEYATSVVKDFMELKLSYKELMAKYHCSLRTLQRLLLECSENDQRIYDEMEFRRH